MSEKGCGHAETLMGGECGCDERPRFVATNGDVIELTDEQAAHVARVLALTDGGRGGPGVTAMSGEGLPIPAEAVEAAAKAMQDATTDVKVVIMDNWRSKGLARAAFDALEVRVEQRTAPWRHDPTLPIGMGEHKEQRLVSRWFEVKEPRFRAATRDELDMTDRTGAG